MSRQVKILVPEQTHLVDLVGQRDELLRRIEGEFSSDILVRGNEITITGDDDDAHRAAVVFEELLTLLRQGQTLTPESVDRAVGMVKADDGPKPSQVLGDTILSVRGRPIRPKTAGQKRYVDAARTNTLTFAIGPAGTGKCVAGETLLLTRAGVLPIEQLAEDGPPDTYQRLDLDVHGIGGLEPATHLYRGGESETIGIWTRLGYSIEATPEHPLVVLDEHGSLVWRAAGNLAEGDYLALQRGQRLFGEQRAVDFSYERPPSDHTSRSVGIAELDVDLAYAMGVLTGDGCLSSRNRIIVSTRDEEIIDMFNRLAMRFGLQSRSLRGVRGVRGDRYIGSAQLRGLLAFLGMSLGLARSKSIPRSILQAPEELVAAFLRGLYDADGSVEARDGRITYSSVSEALVRQVQILLLNFGILSNRSLKRGVYQGRRHLSHLLTITGADADLFGTLVGFGLARKRDRLQSKRRNTNVDVLPHVDRLLDTAVRTATFSRAEHKTFYDYRIGRRKPSPTKARELVALLDRAGATGPELEALRGLSEGSLVFLPIERIVSSRSKVFDLTVPGTHSFVANGFISHNTYLAVAMAVKALRDKEISRIILTRPAVEAGERLGFLPGDLVQKVDPYLKPLYDALYDLVEPGQYGRLAERGTIEVAPLGFMRGRSLNESFIILDEAQNTTPEQMKMFLTRLGLRSKAVVTGDVTQIDLPDGQQSGLVVVQDILREIKGLKFVYLEASDVVRHRIVQDIVEAYHVFEDANPRPKR